MGYLYKTNHDYFSEIDSEEKAYFLGLIYADGNLTKGKGNRQDRLSITLQEEDSYILEKITISNSPIKIYKSENNPKHWKGMGIFGATSNKISSDLLSLGVTYNKSVNGITFPDINPSLYPHFIRGFIDGDGCITLGKRTYSYKRISDRNLTKPAKDTMRLRIAITCTDKQFLLRIVEILNLEKYYIREVTKKLTCYTLWIERQEEVNRVIMYLYQDANYFLKRKFKKVEEYNMTIKSEAMSALIERLTTT